MVKIEVKLKEAMQKIVDLTGEKEHLEHTIDRLQDETDTVGEYITIYHYQRAQQKAQLQEKEKQLHSIARDREELKQKLAQLQGLLTNYLGGEPAMNNTALDTTVTTESASPTHREGKNDNLILTNSFRTLVRKLFKFSLHKRHIDADTIYRISANSFHGNYSFLNLTLCTVTFGDST